MRELRFAVSAAVLSLLIAAGCRQADLPQGSQSVSAAKEGPPLGGPAEVAQASPDARAFIMKAAEGNLLVVALGRLALSKGVSPDVKAFGMRLVSDHSRAYDELRQIAARRGIAVPTQLDAAGKMMVDQMSNLSGNTFDKAFAEHMVQDHEGDVRDYRRAAKGLRDPELRDWAAKMVPVLESHLAQAKEVRAKVGS